MADVRPFRGLRFDPGRVAVDRCVCPPYDVIPPDEQRAYHEADPHNVIRIELGLGPADPQAPGNRYAAAAEALAAWQREGVLVREDRPAIYLHEHTFTLGGTRGARRRGLIVAGRLHQWGEGQVLPHEGTRQGPKQDRLALMRATGANVSPLWLLYDDADGAVRAALEAAWQAPPLLTARAGGETHALRAITDTTVVRRLVEAFAPRPLYIADGHHRYETAQHYRDERRATGAAEPDAGHEFAMMLLTALDDPGLVVLPTHRLVRGLDRTPDQLRQDLSRWLTLTPLPPPAGDDGAAGALLEASLSAAPAHSFGLVDPDGAWLLTPRFDVEWSRLLPDGHSEAWRDLDVAILDAVAIREVCGIRAEGESSHADATSHAPSDRLAYVSDFGGAVRAVRGGEAQAAFLLNPTRVEQVCAVAEAGDRMPPKSTYFWPKPVTGLVIHTLDGTRPAP
jgi:uncharacterized protein (DUF1015 family)